MVTVVIGNSINPRAILLNTLNSQNMPGHYIGFSEGSSTAIARYYRTPSAVFNGKNGIPFFNNKTTFNLGAGINYPINTSAVMHIDSTTGAFLGVATYATNSLLLLSVAVPTAGLWLIPDNNTKLDLPTSISADFNISRTIWTSPSVQAKLRFPRATKSPLTLANDFTGFDTTKSPVAGATINIQTVIMTLGIPNTIAYVYASQLPVPGRGTVKGFDAFIFDTLTNTLVGHVTPDWVYTASRNVRTDYLLYLRSSGTTLTPSALQNFVNSLKNQFS